MTGDTIAGLMIGLSIGIPIGILLFYAALEISKSEALPGDPSRDHTENFNNPAGFQILKEAENVVRPGCSFKSGQPKGKL